MSMLEAVTVPYKAALNLCSTSILDSLFWQKQGRQVQPEQRHQALLLQTDESHSDAAQPILDWSMRCSIG